MILIYEKGKKGSIEVIAEDLQTRLEGYGIDIHKESYDLGECMMAADESKVYMSGKKEAGAEDLRYVMIYRILAANSTT